MAESCKSPILKDRLSRRGASHKNPIKSLTRCVVKYLGTVWPDWAIYWTSGNFLKPLATINLPKSHTFLGNFCKDVKIYHFLVKSFLGNFYWHLAIFLVTLVRYKCTIENDLETFLQVTNWIENLNERIHLNDTSFRVRRFFVPKNLHWSQLNYNRKNISDDLHQQYLHTQVYIQRLLIYPEMASWFR